MKNKILKITIIILAGIVLIYFLKTNFSEYNLKKSISACVVAKKRTSKSFDLDTAKKVCEEKIRKKKKTN